MKKSMIFSLLLLAAVVIATGCSSSKEWTPPGASWLTSTLSAPAQKEYVVKSGGTQRINLTCSQTDIDLKLRNESDPNNVRPTGVAAAKQGSCSFDFNAFTGGGFNPIVNATPGVYNVTATAIRDRSLNYTFKFTVEPNIEIGGTKKILIETEAQFTATGAGLSQSLGNAASWLEWEFDDGGEGIGEIDPETGLFTATDIMGSGTVKAVLYDAYTNAEYEVTFDIKVVENLGITVPDVLVDGGFMPVGRWSDWAPGDPGLTEANIPRGAYLFGAFSPPFYAPITIPPEADWIEEYTKKLPADIPNLKPGEWAVFTTDGGFNYVVIYPIFEAPEVLVDGGFMSVGRWSDWAPGDPGLTGANIPNDAYLFGAFAPPFYAPITIPPEADWIEGHTKKLPADIPNLKPGEWAVFTTDGGFNYIVLVHRGFED